MRKVLFCIVLLFFLQQTLSMLRSNEDTVNRSPTCALDCYKCKKCQEDLPIVRPNEGILLSSINTISTANNSFAINVKAVPIIIARIIQIGIITAIKALWPQNRDDFMRQTLSTLMNQYPDWCIALVSNQHVTGDNCIHQHVEMRYWFGTIGVEVYFGNRNVGFPCRIDHTGDGGWINWAYGGYWNKHNVPGGVRIWI